MGDVPAAELDELPFRRRHVWLQGDERFGTLTPLLVGDGDHGALQHSGMLGHRLLHFDGRDVLATGNDHIFLAVAQLDVAIGMPDRDIAGMEPATRERGSGSLRVVVVALHHVIAVHNDLAHRLTVARHIVHMLIHDASAVSNDVPLPLTRKQTSLFRLWQSVPLRMPLAHGIRAVGLGQAIDVNRAQVELVHLSQQGRRWGRACNGYGDLTFKAVSLGMVHQEDLHRGSAVVMGHAFGLKELPDRAGIQLAQADMRAPDGCHRPGEAPAIAVEHRQRP